ncbi:C-C motif chemokine 13-like [Trichomycterus rosablanca]|uniref:C-C motif chemokine 13-like n=1 Tax=Trichomycterus rosablanca TaxID=2290929 RepID=UPI002F3594F9
MMNLTPLLLLLLVGSLQLVSGAPEGSNSGRGSCCQNTTRVKIPLHRITSYSWTSSDCPIKAVIFETIVGRQICVDPKAPWVKNHVKAVDLKLKSTTTSRTIKPSTSSTAIKNSSPSTSSTAQTTTLKPNSTNSNI